MPLVLKRIHSPSYFYISNLISVWANYACSN